MAWSVRHRQHQHIVAVAAADLYGLARLPAKVMHFAGGDTHEIQRPGIGETVMIKTRAEPDGTVGIAAEHVLFDQIIDDDIDGRKRRLDRLGNRIGSSRCAGFVEIIDHLQRAVDAAYARAAYAFGFRFPRGINVFRGCGG
ncbi:conserved hypothetical protein [Ricinus communis]|uniref:Uncharacterized protein n=1 Tax=Ricinus communis TaxID=3988 RepID=B9TJJ1_RICCO|nr:conserved hypothetical protein [Ricinus communis]